MDDLARRGYCTDEWRTWQQGNCLDYARALIMLRPELRFGTLIEHDGEYDVPVHHFAHDDRHAYDSAGRHALPYRGIDGLFTPILDDDDTAYDEMDSSRVEDAIEHAKRNGILNGKYGASPERSTHAQLRRAAALPEVS